VVLKGNKKVFKNEKLSTKKLAKINMFKKCLETKMKQKQKVCFFEFLSTIHPQYMYIYIIVLTQREIFFDFFFSVFKLNKKTL